MLISIKSFCEILNQIFLFLTFAKIGRLIILILDFLGHCWKIETKHSKFCFGKQLKKLSWLSPKFLVFCMFHSFYVIFTAPTSKMAEVLTKTVKEAKDMISKVRHFSQKILILHKFILSQILCQADNMH